MKRERALEICRGSYKSEFCSAYACEETMLRPGQNHHALDNSKNIPHIQSETLRDFSLGNLKSITLYVMIENDTLMIKHPFALATRKPTTKQSP